MSYFVFDVINGDPNIQVYDTRKEFLDTLNKELEEGSGGYEYVGPDEDLSKWIDLWALGDKLLVIRGRVVAPSTVEVKTEYTIE